MPASRGKALPLLRTINAFLRFLPRTPEDLVFRGRVHQFASSVISIADKSAINLRGDYNEVKTVWDEPITEEQAGHGDIEMEEKGVDQDKKNADIKPEADFYSTLWSLQQSFAHPPSLAPSPQVGTPRTPSTSTTSTPFASFRQKSEIVLPVLFEQTKKQKELMGREVEGVSKKRKRGESAEQEGGFFHPRYLTGKKLLEHEVSKVSHFITTHVY
jgi:THO complex subunit 1